MKKSKILISTLISSVALPIGTISACSNHPTIKKITIDCGGATEVEQGKTLQFNATIEPKGAEGKIAWFCSGKVGQIDPESGLFTADTETTGKAEIYAYSVDSTDIQSNHIFIDVVASKITSITIDCGEVQSVELGGTVQFNASVSPETTKETFTWYVNDETLGSIDNKGEFTASDTKTGKVTIYAQSDIGKVKSNEISLEVVPPKISKITISCSATKVALGKTLQFNATITPEKAKKDINWIVDPTSLGSFDATDKFTASSTNTGEATIYAESKDGSVKSNEIKITIYDPTIPSKVTISVPEQEIYVGNKTQFTASVEPSTAEYTIEWCLEGAPSDEYVTLSNEGVLEVLQLPEEAKRKFNVYAKVTNEASGVSLTSNKIEMTAKDYVADNFETDSWDVVIHFANKGLNDLKKAYETWLKSHNNTFVGAIRTVDVYDVTQMISHRVRVIGEGHDLLANQTGQKAALTFEFADVLTSIRNPSQTLFKFNDSPALYNNYWKYNEQYCTLRTNMVSRLKSLMPNNIVKSVKTVQKQYWSADQTGCLVSDETFFILTYAEFGGYYPTFFPSSEGTCYAYYDPYIASPTLAERRFKPMAGGEELGFSYWLRSPYIGTLMNESQVTAYYDSETETAYWLNPNDSLCIAPCFCI